MTDRTRAGKPGAPAVRPAAYAAPRRRGLVALTATGVLWGTIGIAVRLLQDRGDPTVAIAFWRLVYACVVLAPLIGRSGMHRLRRHLRRPGRLAAVAVGSLTFQLLFFFAVADVGVAVATLVALGLAPLVLTAADALAARSLPAPRTLSVLLLALAGLALVTASGGADAQVAPRPLLGLSEAVLSGLAYAATTAWSGPLSARLPPLAITFATSTTGLLLLLPVVALTGWHPPSTAPVLAGTAWLGVVSTVIAYGLFYAGLRSTPGSVAMILTLLEPVTAVFLAAVLLGEPLTIANVLGGTLLLLAVAALYLKPRAG